MEKKKEKRRCNCSALKRNLKCPPLCRSTVYLCQRFGFYLKCAANGTKTGVCKHNVKLVKRAPPSNNNNNSKMYVEK